MNILFLTISLPNLATDQGGFYVDLIKELGNKGHNITCMAPALKGQHNGIYEEGAFKTLRVETGDFIGNIPFWKKGVNILLMTRQYKKAYRRYLSKEPFDIVIMPTPPATFVDVVSYIKKCCNVKLYLILRDIHPECLDRKVIPQRFLERNDVYDECKHPYGVNPLVYKLLYNKSQKLYQLADKIGCMSPGNMEYVKQIAPYVADEQLAVLPNWYKGGEKKDINDTEIRVKYNLKNKFIAIFGGTIGEAQAVWNIAQLAKMNLDKKDVVFLVVGRGVKKHTLEEMARNDNLTNIVFMEYMPRNDYEAILRIADLGLISLDEKYKVPTCPSKIIGYMALGKPVLAMFNKGSDYGDFYIDKSGCGLWSVDLDHKKMQENFEWFYTHPDERKQMGLLGYDYYKKHFSVEVVAEMLDAQLHDVL